MGARGVTLTITAPTLCEADAVLGQNWESQWELVDRRLEGVREVYAGAPGGTDIAIERVQLFFEAVYHLKDWIGNDPSVSVTKDQAEQLVKRCLVLLICGDLANSSKHLKLTSTRTGDISTGIKRNDVTVYAGTGTSAHTFEVLSHGQKYDVLELAEDAVDEWRDFLSRHGVLKTPAPDSSAPPDESTVG